MLRFIRTHSLSELRLKHPPAITDKPSTPRNITLEAAIENVETDNLRKIIELCETQVQSLEAKKDGTLRLRQCFKEQDIITIQKIPREIVQNAYLKGVDMLERYCALTDLKSPRGNNANRIMNEYIDYIKSHNKHSEEYDEDIYWFKKDYQAGSGNQNLEADIMLIARANDFFERLHNVDKKDSPYSLQKHMSKTIKKDKNPLVALITMRLLMLGE